LFRYYVSQKAIRSGYGSCDIKSIGASHIDELVTLLVVDHLGETLDHLKHCDKQVRDHWLRAIIRKVVLAPEQMRIELDDSEIGACKDFDWADEKKKSTLNGSICSYKPAISKRPGLTILKLDIAIRHHDRKRQILSPDGNALTLPSNPKAKDHIVMGIGNAYRWRELMVQENLSARQIASQLGVSENQIRKYLPLINLSPAILKAALSGRMSASVTMANLLVAARNHEWAFQEQFLGMSTAGN
jgi:hypothetical protein